MGAESTLAAGPATHRAQSRCCQERRRCPGPPRIAGCGVRFAGSSDTARLRFRKRSRNNPPAVPRLPRAAASSLREGSWGWGSQPQPVSPPAARGLCCHQAQASARNPLLRRAWRGHRLPSREGELLGAPHRGRTSTATPRSARTAT